MLKTYIILINYGDLIDIEHLKEKTSYFLVDFFTLILCQMEF